MHPFGIFFQKGPQNVAKTIRIFTIPRCDFATLQNLGKLLGILTFGATGKVIQNPL